MYLLLGGEAKSHVKKETNGTGGIGGILVVPHQLCLIQAFQALLNPYLAQEVFHDGPLSCLSYARAP